MRRTTIKGRKKQRRSNYVKVFKMKTEKLMHLQFPFEGFFLKMYKRLYAYFKD